MRILLKILGWAMIGFAALGIAVEVDNLRSGKREDVAVGVVMVILFGGGGALLVRAARRKKEAHAGTGPTLEQRVLAAARRHQGLLTAVKAAADGGLTIEEARQELERLAKQNACLMDVSADGLVEFRFPEFQAPEKSST